MAKVFFQKELFSNRYFVAGKPVEFEQLDGNRGVLALDEDKDFALISALNEAASKRRGGVVKISEDQYNEKKNAHPFRQSKPASKETLRALAPVQTPPRTSPGQQNGAAAAVKPAAMKPGEASLRPLVSEDPLRNAFRPTTSRLKSR